MAHEDKKARSWKFWKKWIGTAQEKDEEALDASLKSNVNSTSLASSASRTLRAGFRDPRITGTDTRGNVNSSTDSAPNTSTDSVPSVSAGSTILEEIERLKEELDALRPLPSDILGRG